MNGHAANSKKMNPIIKDTTGSNRGNQKIIPIKMALPVTPSTPEEKLRNSNTREIMPKTDEPTKHSSRNTNGLSANGKANINSNRNHQDDNDDKNIPKENDGLNPKSLSKHNNKQMLNEEQKQDEIIVEVSEETVEESDEDVSENQEKSTPLKSSRNVPIENINNVQVQKPETASSKNLAIKNEYRNVNPENNLPPIKEEDDEWSGSRSESYSYEEN